MSRQINRANQLWQNWQDKQKMLEGLFSAGQVPDRNFSRQKYDFLGQGIARIGVNATPDEKIVLDLLKGMAAKLEKQLYPNRLVRLLVQVKNLVYDKPRYLKQQAALRAENLESLKVYLDSSGMGSFSGRLENYLDYERAQVNIDLSTQLSGSKRLDVTLHLQKDETGRYQLPDFTAGIVDKGFPAEKREYTFEANGWTDIKTVANLLEGRPVFFTRQQQQEQNYDYVWKQLDFSEAGKGTLQEYRYSYGFDPNTYLKDLAKATGIPAIANEKVLYHLEKGDAVRFKCPASGETLFLQANPGDKNILIKDANQKPVTVATLIARQQTAKRRGLDNSLKLSRKRGPEKQQANEQSLGIA